MQENAQPRVADDGGGMSHTPGPWTVSIGCDMTNDSYVIHEDDGNGVGPEMAANARVIAAAPDLLLALENLLVSHDLNCQGEDCQLMGIDLARAAVSKARGTTMTTYQQ
jgi:hypothetical protein